MKVDLDKIQQGHLKPLLDEFENAVATLGIDFYLIGAVARDVIVTGIHKNALGRITKDIDFAVYISNNEDYDALRNLLISTGKFVPTKGNAFALIYDDRTTVDLLPFGAGVDDDGRVHVEGKGMTSISVEGFEEIFQHGTSPIELVQGNNFKVCTLPGIVLLKIIAYDDRPEVRAKDIKDIGAIIETYHNICHSEMLEDHLDLVEMDPYDERIIAARILGRQIKLILVQSEELHDRIRIILETTCSAGVKSQIAPLLLSDKITTVD